MKPSEYIRIGATLRPNQAFHKLTEGEAASCAMAALVEGFVGRRIGDSRMFWLTLEILVAPRMPWLTDRPAECPMCPVVANVWDTAVHLNNCHRWSREEIGDWLDAQQALAEGPPAREAETPEEEREMVLA